MRWLKFGIIIVLFFGAVYAVSMTFVDESKNFTIEKEINYPVDKVFPQFNNLQNFTRWNSFFADNKNLSVQYFTPYEGKGSAMSFHDRKDESNFGDFFIRYENPGHTLRYQFFEGKKNTPYEINLRFISENDKTRIIWYVHTPKQSFLRRPLNLISEDFWVSKIDKSMKNLYQLLGNKVNKETQLESLKFDSLTVEQQDSQLLLGINVTTKNNALFKNIAISHNKVLNYVKMDLGKKDDEYGEPILINDADNYKDKEVSYFYGIPLSKKETVTDNNFSFRTLKSGKYYVIYYKGNYEGRIRAIQQLLTKAKQDTMRIGDLQQTFLEEPTADNKTVMKLSLPVYK
ncbi:polyketide cyclase [Chryseobacterium gotjawalense]|uniref:Polyketide cyclase n=1 Tax=Chryseobacterium gotjawalense TaxID=3042315 RepID=A0ABY8RHF3_9FLAO|nr:polyketide cyclase [Chryseobacterium sp. wdc7]WHF52658.1 polyketide cyclase [Chryseobacterium sp. wdc7]